MAGRPSDADFRDWLIFAALATVGTAVVVLANPITMTSAAISAALVIALQVLYWFLARPSVAGIRQDSWRAWTFGAIALVAFTAAVILNPWASLALFALCPEIFLLLTPAAAAIAVVLINAIPLVFRLTINTVPLPDAVQLIGTTVFIIAFSIFFSGRMLAVTAQNEERRRLIDELHEREAQVAALSAERGAGAERARIAREMHDTLAQGFTSIITLGHAVEHELDTDPDAVRRHVALITETARENLDESRRIIAALTPSRLEDASLAEALRRLVDRFQAETGVAAEFVLNGTEHPEPPAIEVVILRVAQECLANVRKHASAGNVDVVLSYSADSLSLSVLDDGVGFDPESVGSERVNATPSRAELSRTEPSRTGSSRTGSSRRESVLSGRDGGYGLRGMHERVNEAGGSLEVRSDAGAGTGIRVTVPLPVEPLSADAADRETGPAPLVDAAHLSDTTSSDTTSSDTAQSDTAQSDETERGRSSDTKELP
ncbi:sensor histidine kinase [Rathayibacter sp. CAU 1779]